MSWRGLRSNPHYLRMTPHFLRTAQEYPAGPALGENDRRTLRTDAPRVVYP
jgi:hypothetical protein